MAVKESDVRTLLDLSPICNKIIDIEGKLRYMSRAGIQMLKIADVEEHYGKEYPVSFFPVEVRNNLRDCCQRAIQGETCSTETKAIDTEGCEVWFSTTFVPVLDESGQVTFVIASSVDISEEVNYRNHLEKMVTERTKENRELQEHLFQAQKTKAIGSLAAGIAHDFNNVLGMILGAVEMQKYHIGRGNVSVESLNDCFSTVVDAINRASELSSQLIGFARKGKYVTRPLDVNKLLDELKNLLQKGLNSTNAITLKTVLIAKNFIEADAVQIGQIVQNLVFNARDALPNGGEIYINTKDEVVESERRCYGDSISAGNYVVISVSDNGTGIKQEILDNIFDPFFSTKPRELSTGLGLASVLGIVRNHNGFVDVHSEVNKGTKFDIYFPAVDPIVEQEKVQQPAGDQDLISRVLVVDDEPVVQKIIKEYYSQLGLEVRTASSGTEALSIYRSEAIDLVLADLVMDQMDGIELFFEILKINSEANVFLMSGYHEDEKVKEAIAGGARGLLKKPFRLEDLKKVVQQCRTR